MKFNFDTNDPLTTLLIGSVWLIAGCSGKPGDADIKKALAIHTAQGASQLKHLANGTSHALMPQVHG
ncbi:MAG: hypothetical protein EOP12_02370 [Pseudomonas sp.]|nr:MAG: hypothetical protein EOP12_02370 [Pseudomonas sp.]